MGFKESIQEYGKQITASFSCGGTSYTDSEISSFKRHYDGALLKSVMKCLDVQLEGIRSVPGDTLTGCQFGVKGPAETTYSYITFGTYIVKNQDYDDDTISVNLECYDLMIYSMVPYDLQLDYAAGSDGTSTITVKVLLDAICERLGWTPGYTTFTNSSVIIDGEKYDNSYTFRDVLDEIAEVAAGTIAFVNDTLQVLYPTESGETIDASNLKTLNIGNKYGPINSIVISRTPQEDNIYKRDDASIDTNGLTEIKIENNQIMDSHRDDFIEGIYNRLNGLEFYLYSLESYGIGYIDLCDIFTLKTLDNNTYKTIMLNDSLEATQGLLETSAFEEPEKTETDYTVASEEERSINNALLRVNKQEQLINAIAQKTETAISDIDGLKTEVTRMAELIIDPASVDIKIKEAVEGIDSVETENGYRFDKTGLHITESGAEVENTVDHTGMYVKRTEDGEEVLTANQDGVNALNLTSRQYLIVGNNSRFEDYDNGTDSNRTACFYIGG